jgi:sec-independent protein translocase protein TatA
MATVSFRGARGGATRLERSPKMGLDNPVHILLLLLVVLLVFGAKRLPEIGRSLGGGMRGFKDSLSGAPVAAVEAPAPAAATHVPTVTAEPSEQHAS